jgi:hypothetical protein
MLDEINFKSNETNVVLEELAAAAEACLSGNGTIHSFNNLVERADNSGFLKNVGPYAAACVLRKCTPSARGLIQDRFPEKTSEEIDLIVTAMDEHQGLIIAKKAVEEQTTPEFISFVQAFPDDFLMVYVALRDNCERTLSLLMDKVRHIGFEFMYADGHWTCFRFDDRFETFHPVLTVSGYTYVRSGMLAMISARIYELGSALKEVRASEGLTDS